MGWCLNLGRVCGEGFSDRVLGGGAAGFAAGVGVLGDVGEGLEGANKLNSLLSVNC